MNSNPQPGRSDIERIAFVCGMNTDEVEELLAALSDAYAADRMATEGLGAKVAANAERMFGPGSEWDRATRKHTERPAV